MAIPGPSSAGRRVFLRLFRWRIILRRRPSVQNQSTIQTSHGTLLRGLFASGAFALVVASIYEYLALAGVIDMDAARGVLFFAWAIGTVGTLASESVASKSITHKIVSTFLVGLVLGIGFIILDAWTMGYRARQEDRYAQQPQSKNEKVKPQDVAKEQPRSEPPHLKAEKKSTETQRPKPTPQLNLIFKNTPLFTEARKERIAEEMEKFYRYLVRLGLDAPRDLPPIGVTKGGDRGVVIYPFPVYMSSIYISEKSIDDPRAARGAYSSYCFFVLLDAYNPNRHDRDSDRRHTAAWVFRDYFEASFSKSPPPSGTSQLYKWLAVLWDVRQQLGEAPTDRMVAFTLKSFNDFTDLNPKEDFDYYFYLSMVRGGAVIFDNKDSSWRQIIKDAMLKNGFSNIPSF
jgi:hypothetical protein